MRKSSGFLFAVILGACAASTTAAPATPKAAPKNTKSAKGARKVPAKPKPLNAKRLTGTYKSGENMIRILALDEKRLKLEFELYSRDGAPSSGYVAGEATIDADTAKFVKLEQGASAPCTITLRAAPGNALTVEQAPDAECPFGARVYATGSYAKLSSKKPKFAGSEPSGAPTPDPGMKPVPAAEIAKKYGRDGVEALDRWPIISQKMTGLEADFMGFGLAGDNAAFRDAAGREILVLCGVPPRVAGSAQYLVAFQPANGLLYFTKDDRQGTVQEFGVRDNGLKAAIKLREMASCP